MAKRISIRKSIAGIIFFLCVSCICIGNQDMIEADTIEVTVTSDELQSPSVSNSSDFEIEDGVLLEYTGLEQKVIIPDGVEEIADEVFYKNKRIEEVVFPESLRKIGKRAFSCTKLTEIDFKQVEEIGEAAFSNCTSLSGVLFPESIRVIGKEAFYHCSSLRYIVFEEGVVSIGDWAFAKAGCDHRVEMIKLAASIEELGDFSFGFINSAVGGDNVKVYIPKNIKAKINPTVFANEEVGEGDLLWYSYRTIIYGYEECSAFFAASYSPGEKKGEVLFYSGERLIGRMDFINMEYYDVNELFDYTKYINGWLGDTNQDDVVDLGDAKTALMWALGIEEPKSGEYIKYVDYNGNGVVDLEDVTQVLRKALGIIL